MADRGWYPRPRPRRKSPDGIAARSRRGSIGGSWWSRRFIEALEALTEPRRLARGRSYARSGQVAALEVGSGTAAATVQGSRRTPYAVRIAVPPLTAEEWERVEQAMAQQAIFMAALLAGEMPDQIEEAFSAAGVSLFPRSSRELATDCSCPDRSNPCKHVAATLYILAEAFDDDPFLIFAWRGRTRDELVDRLRVQRAAAGEPSARAESAGAGSVPPGDEAVAPLPGAPADFWRPAAPLDALHFAPRAPDVPDAVIGQLGPPPLHLRGGGIIDRLRALYPQITRAAERRAAEEGSAATREPL